MIMRKTTKRDVAEWDRIYKENAATLSPNAKTGYQLAEYLKQKYTLAEIKDKAVLAVVEEDVSNSDFYMKKLQPDMKLKPVVYELQDIGNGYELYSNRDDAVRGTTIIIGIELNTGYFTVVGSTELYDEIFFYKGLDEYDLENSYVVAQYILARDRYKSKTE